MWAAKCGLILDADPRTSTSASMEILRGFLHLNVSPYLSTRVDRLFQFRFYCRKQCRNIGRFFSDGCSVPFTDIRQNTLPLIEQSHKGPRMTIHSKDGAGQMRFRDGAFRLLLLSLRFTLQRD